MTRSCGWAAGMIAVLSILTTNTVSAQLMSTCVPDSPERRGEIGCSIIQSKALPEGLTEPVFWHIDRFDSLERARAAAGPASIAFDAAGTWWRNPARACACEVTGKAARRLDTGRTGRLSYPCSTGCIGFVAERARPAR